MECLATLGKTFRAESFDWVAVRKLGLLNHCVKHTRPPTCGKILAHAKNQITAFRTKIGVRTCVFKIGVTANPPQRFTSYKKLGFDALWVLTASDSVDLIHMLEAACIDSFQAHVGCRNKSESGGEGALNRATNTLGPPYYLYVTGGDAAQPRRIG